MAEKLIEDNKYEFNPNIKNVMIISTIHPEIAWVPNVGGVCRDCGKKSTKSALNVKNHNHVAYSCNDCFIGMKF